MTPHHPFSNMEQSLGETQHFLCSGEEQRSARFTFFIKSFLLLVLLDATSTLVVLTPVSKLQTRS